MDTFLHVTPLVVGIWMISIALWVSAKDALSSVIFKIIPFFLGAASCIVGLKLMGIV